MVQLRDDLTSTDPRLDRIPRDDARNRNYPIRALLNPEVRPRSYTWACADHLDQGQEGACVGFGFAHELIAKPRVVAGVSASYARTELYWNIQRNDAWPGGAYPGADPFYEGTSVLDGAAYMKAHGWYDEYRWALSEEDLCLAVGYHGPAVIGVNWWTGMMDTDTNGMIHKSGQIEGGHCTLVKGVSLRHGRYIIHQSWGASWGVGGDCMISREDMAALLADQGEACVPVVRMPRTSV